ncbi:membrane anchoring protein efr3a [Mortierella alpina]|nr:membrane anchoring protein efr3a [Mortierella alpina]
MSSSASIRSRSASVSASSLHGLLLDGSAPPPTPPVPLANATHSSFIPTRYVKHASLINNCYPTRPDEKGPKSSELSYLVFYATSKPAKLTKVGNFIERRVVRDYRKRRLQDVHCSLEIIKSLVLSSKAHLNIFSKNVVVILDTLLADISDYDIVRHCQNIFKCFCAAHDGSTLGVDVEFRTIYDRVLARFANIANLRGDNSNRYRVIGLRALQGVVSSSALYACDPRAQLDLVLPPILDSLIDSKDGIQVSLESCKPTASTSPRNSVSVHGPMVDPDSEITDSEVTAEGLQCLCALFKTPNGGNVKLSLGPTFSYLEENDCWWPTSLGVGIIKSILNSIQPQIRYMVVNEIIARLDNVEATTQDLAFPLQKKVTLISALESILISPLSLIGMPVLEVLNSLLTTLTKSLSESALMSKEGESSQLLVLETLIQDGLVRSIGGLATHIYYTNQVPHIISHIVSKLSFKINALPQPDMIEAVPTVEYRKALLRCLTAVIKTSKDHGRQEAGFQATEVSSDLLTPCLGLLLSDNVGVRAAFAQSLVTFLATEDDGHHSGTQLSSPAPAVSSDLYFRAATHQTLHAYARLPTATPTDMAAIYGILRALFTHFQDDEFMRVVPVLFSLQDWCLQEDSGQTDSPNLVARKRALATVIVIYLQKAVSFYQMAEPQEYLDNIQHSRESESQWSPIYYENQESLTRTTIYQWDTPSEPLSPVLTHPLARDHLVTLLTTVSDRFRAGAERLGLTYSPESHPNSLAVQNSKDLTNGLFPSPLAMNGGHGLLGHKVARSMDSRIRISRHLEDWALPKIVPATSSLVNDYPVPDEAAEYTLNATREGSYASTQLKTSESIQSHKTIGVDNLKAALTAVQLGVDTTSDTASSFSGSESRAATPALQRLYPQSVHPPSLLSMKQVGAGGSTVSLASNLAASRPDLADILNTIQVTAPSNHSKPSLVTPPY